MFCFHFQKRNIQSTQCVEIPSHNTYTGQIALCKSRQGGLVLLKDEHIGINIIKAFKASGGIICVLEYGNS